jgi:hypothetical protein
MQSMRAAPTESMGGLIHVGGGEAQDLGGGTQREAQSRGAGRRARA